MALIHPRVAQNFIKAGYYPTDELTLERILSAINTSATNVRIFDPCCGEGVALSEVKHHLSELGAEVQALGIEFDEERAWHAKRLLSTVLHSDMNDTFISGRSCDLLFLNPPYGFAVKDQQGGEKSDRLEKMFWRKTITSVSTDGVIVLIVPYTVFDEEFSQLITTHLRDISVWMAPEKQFKQAVLFGYKRKNSGSDAFMLKRLMAMSHGELPPELPEFWTLEPYRVPQCREIDKFTFRALRINPKELSSELDRFHSHTLWDRFDVYFSSSEKFFSPPLRQLSPWHLALALAAGLISGFVTSIQGRTLLIKGDTVKEKSKSVTRVEDVNGNVSETVIMTDRFIPSIKAIDFTEGSETFGAFVSIR